MILVKDIIGMEIIVGKYEFIAPCHFGLEAVLKKEIIRLGYEIVKVEDGKVTFTGDSDAICRANIFLRTTERILLKIGSFKATTFDDDPKTSLVIDDLIHDITKEY